MDEKGAKGTFKGWADRAGGGGEGMLHYYPECCHVHSGSEVTKWRFWRP